MEPHSYQEEENTMTKFHSLIRTEIHCPLLHATRVLMPLESRFEAHNKPDLHAMLEGGDE